MDHLREMIRCYRSVNGLSVRDTARRIGISPSTLNRFERLDDGMSAESLSKVLVWALSERRTHGR
jgi:transcriptional regulator with XRE-family HTH domain